MLMYCVEHTRRVAATHRGAYHFAQREPCPMPCGERTYDMGQDACVRTGCRCTACQATAWRFPCWQSSSHARPWWAVMSSIPCMWSRALVPRHQRCQPLLQRLVKAW